MRIGICGGTFDPFHRGHLDPVLAVRDAMQWTRILYIPAFQQPFKAGLEHVSGYHRFAMAVLATEALDAIHVSPLELERGAISYTVDTLEELRMMYPAATLDWIIGDDNLAKLTEWRALDRILELANFAVLTRLATHPAVPAALAHRVIQPDQRKQAGSIVFARNATVPVSSTEIRGKIRAGEPVGQLVDGRVSRYIHHYGLYKEGLT
ncbi:MAG TPA: nicotinate (nicotinamide) nucleotide adenylyltransferase [Thermoanaerobaculia bacterium]|jgi:nicotinate-nucleotide adenylyltransferase